MRKLPLTQPRADECCSDPGCSTKGDAVEPTREEAVTVRAIPLSSKPELRAPAGGPRQTFIVEGMCCADEAREVDRAIRAVRGAQSVFVDVIGARVTIEGRVHEDEVLKAVAKAGMKARPVGVVTTRGFWKARGRLVAMLVSGAALGAGVTLDVLGLRALPTVSLYTASIVFGAWFVAPRAVQALRRRSLDMHVLMTTAAAGAAAIGDWREGASAMFLFAVAQMLEAYAMERARSAIGGLVRLAPKEANVVRDGHELCIPVAEVRVGETVLVKPGEKIPLDGMVIEGDSAVNEAPITGESIPVDKTKGARVFAGTLNGQGALDIRTTHHVEDTQLARILAAVEAAQATRAPSQTFVERFSRVYTPAVVAAAIIVAVVPPLLAIGPWSTWLYRALAMLVVACPCALVISTPVSVVSGLAAAARGGVLVKGGAHLEAAARVTTVAFDKTGTLTRGNLAVTAVFPVAGRSGIEILRGAAAVERSSEHPVGRAIVAHARKHDVTVPRATGFAALPGRGARAEVDDHVVHVGNERLLGELGCDLHPARTEIDTLESEGNTVVLVAIGDELVGAIAVADEVRSSAAAAIKSLRRVGVEDFLLLTGDNERTARAVGKRVGVDDVRAGLLPDQKVEAVQALESNGRRVLFVGDGINDAPALAAATLGAAMGTAGTEVALEAADLTLAGDDLGRLAFVIELAKRTVSVIRQNVGFSLATKGIFVALAIGGWATLWMAVAADMGASLLVIANGLRLLRAKRA